MPHDHYNATHQQHNRSNKWVRFMTNWFTQTAEDHRRRRRRSREGVEEVIDRVHPCLGRVLLQVTDKPKQPHVGVLPYRLVAVLAAWQFPKHGVENQD